MFNILFINRDERDTQDDERRRLIERHLPYFGAHLGNLLQDAIIVRAMNLAGSSRDSISLLGVVKLLDQPRGTNAAVACLREEIEEFKVEAERVFKEARDKYVVHLSDSLERPRIISGKSVDLARKGHDLAERLGSLAGDTSILSWPNGTEHSTTELLETLKLAGVNASQDSQLIATT